MDLENAIGRVDDVGEVLVGNDGGGVLAGNDGGEVMKPSATSLTFLKLESRPSEKLPGKIFITVVDLM